MTAIAPQMILDANAALKRHKNCPRSYRFSGIAGDVHHSFGYHVDPDELPPSDYSLQLHRDRRGEREHPRWASAWDLSFNPHDMALVTGRLLAAAKRCDPRMAGVREFCGTLNGWQTYPWDLSVGHGGASEGINSWDASHCWHDHISFYRDATPAQVLAVVEVICGVRMGVVQATKAAASRATGGGKPRWTLQPGNYYGLVSGPPQSHGGYYPSERAAIRLIQQRLQRAGFAPKVSSWADGIYGKPTAVAVQHWQHAKHRPVTGRITEADWKALI